MKQKTGIKFKKMMRTRAKQVMFTQLAKLGERDAKIILMCTQFLKKNDFVELLQRIEQ